MNQAKYARPIGSKFWLVRQLKFVLQKFLLINYLWGCGQIKGHLAWNQIDASCRWVKLVGKKAAAVCHVYVEVGRVTELLPRKDAYGLIFVNLFLFKKCWHATLVRRPPHLLLRPCMHAGCVVYRRRKINQQSSARAHTWEVGRKSSWWGWWCY